MRFVRLSLGVLCLTAFPSVGADVYTTIHVDPPTVHLHGPDARQSLLVAGTKADGQLVDLTHEARFQIADDKVAFVENNVVRIRGDGKTSISVEVAGITKTVTVESRDTAIARRYHFENDIEPLFGRFGCNSSGCHGKAEGQNGFKLSVFGFDSKADYHALVTEARGRRVFAAAPERSLFLTKASGQVPHGGGIRIAVGSDAYATIRGWIAAGAPMGDADVPIVKSLRVEPSERILAMNARQQLRVIAIYSDGREADVTHTARFQTNNERVAAVAPTGRVTTLDAPGEAAIMASFANAVGVFRAMVPRAETIAFPKLSQRNAIDELVDAKLKKLHIVPSGPASDLEYLRRVYLDVIGTLPTSDEIRGFQANPSKDKRRQVVDALLQRGEYADYWALKWADVLRVDRQALGSQAAYAYYRWIREGIAKDKPFDRFAREIVTAEGPIDEVPPAAFYKVVNKPGEAANTLSQVFLGVRIGCAECHHHPFDRWGQNDYYGMAAFFTPVSVKKLGTTEAIVSQGDATAKHLRTSETVHALALGATATKAKPGDRREELAAWLTAADNPFFARNYVNRLWAHFLGRGLVESVDDVRSTNPPTNPELLDALAKHFIASKFDAKAMIRLICDSRVYQTSTMPNETNAKDDQNYSRALFKRPDAEVLLDMVTQVTGVPEKFDGTSLGTRAIQLWDSKVRHYFLKQFGRPVRASACECERTGEPNIAQVLHLLNSDFIQDRLRHEDGRIAKLCRTHADDNIVLDELWLTALGRDLTAQERALTLEHLKKAPKRREAFEDLTWALLNSKEFLFNR